MAVRISRLSIHECFCALISDVLPGSSVVAFSTERNPPEKMREGKTEEKESRVRKENQLVLMRN